ncbi:MAG TPA: 3'-5' exonuclease [Chitinophagaceae bacterium]
METPDNKISQTRQTMYQKDRHNFDDICFTVFNCPSCGKQTMDLTLLPIVDKEQYSFADVRSTQESTLAKIFDADFDFLHEKGICDCISKPTLELKRVIYCYNQGDIDYHNYIDYPFEQIKKFQISLSKKSSTKTFLFFDTETTGLPKNWKASYKELNNWPRLVQIAWISADNNGNIADQKNYLVKPNGFTIPDDATRVHRISTQKALQNGSELHFVLNQFNECVSSADYLVAHNLSFDINVVASELFRFKIESEIFEKKQICTMESSTNFCKLPGNYGYKFPKLSELHQKLFHATFDEAHDASVDIKATVKCFYELLKNKTIKI